MEGFNMRTINFNKTECGVDFLLNVLPGDQVKDSYTHTDIYNTDYFEILFFKKAEGSVILNSQKLEISNNSIVFISAFQKRQWNLRIYFACLSGGLPIRVFCSQAFYLPPPVFLSAATPVKNGSNKPADVKVL